MEPRYLDLPSRRDRRVRRGQADTHRKRIDNVHARHRKPTQTNPQGGIERKEAALHVSNVAIATADGKPSRVRFEVRDGKKVRVAAKTGELIHG